MHDHVAGRKGPEKEQSPAPYLADISLIFLWNLEMEACKNHL